MCAKCDIRLERVATLGDNDGPGAISTFRVAFAKDAAGRYLVSEGAPLSVFSAKGQFMRTVGRRGGGPGEYRRIWRIAPYSQGTIIFDDRAKRSTVLSLDFTVIDTRPAPETPLSVIARNDRSGVMASFINTPSLKGIPLHEFDAQGAFVRSYGKSRTPYREDLRDLFERHVSQSTVSNRYWINHRRDYTFAHCTFGSETCRAFVRPVEWFPEPTFVNWYDRQHLDPPPPQLIAVSQDDDRFLWTLTWVADRRWRSSVKLATRNESHITDFDGYFDTIVERIDLRTNAVVVSKRFDTWFSSFAAPGELWSYREDDEGIGRIDVFRLRIEQ